MEQTKNEVSHIDIGRDLDLFFFDDVSPGSCFFLPHGTILLNNLINLMRGLYKKYGYKEVSTPVMCDKKLWITSGHYDKYKENMFHIDNNINEQYEFSICPMNCPKHIIMFKHMNPSYRDLPIRLADFGILHRNELSGSITGLTRQRMFRQDDSHTICMESQIEEEIKGILKMLKQVYELFGLKYEMVLSTRPEKYIGTLELWEKSEQILKKCILENTDTLNIDEGGGAFYGNKIDILVEDSRKRKHQLGTIQLDFNLPERFGLKYKTASDDSDKSFETPVMIHKAIFGSLERFIAILLEHTNGNLPFVISPRQIAILPVSEKHLEYANQVKNSLVSIYSPKYTSININPDAVDILVEGTIAKRVLNSEQLKYNYIIVVGNKEIEKQTVCVRTEGEGKLVEYSINKFFDFLHEHNGN
ncbi:MAG: THS1-like protein [Terrestrivirus sp.]|uniref:threonine--tRNA ligase n=1 Tax=Terrestrivirus sp. TaxID=2487775 RepID=A0A3G4ZL94_9VIRU|nr:MAG: THS1-like protein [Terrestrivirus sp.]